MIGVQLTSTSGKGVDMPGWLWFLSGFALGGFAVGFLFIIAVTEGWKELFNR